MPNKIVPINPKSDPTNQTAQINSNFAKLDADTVTKAFSGPTGKDAFIEGQLPNNLGSGVLMNDLNGTPSIIMATDPQGQPVLKVAKAGQDATTTTDDGLIFNSSRNTFKIVDTGTVSLTYGTTSTVQIFQTVVPHGRPNIPMVQAYMEFGGVKVPLPYTFIAYESTLNSMSIAAMFRAAVDATNLTFQAVISSKITAGDTVSIKYYILAESAG